MKYKKENIVFLSDILPENIKIVFEKAKFEKEILNYFKSLLNDSIKKHCKPIYISSQNIIIAVDNPLWANEIINYKHHLIKDINKKFNDYVRDIKPRFLPKYFEEREDNKKLNKEDEEFIQQHVQNISNSELKEKLVKLIETFIILDKK